MSLEEFTAFSSLSVWRKECVGEGSFSGQFNELCLSPRQVSGGPGMPEFHDRCHFKPLLPAAG